jgi:hypothetical protein
MRIRGCLVLLIIFIIPIARLGRAASPEGPEKTPKPWYLQPVQRPHVPRDSSNPIDAFIAAEYKAKELKPIGQADKRTLLRRVYLDLIGLPPTPAEQEAFEQDKSPDAYDKVVDRLLDSEQHGVRYARHWLDVLRYADADEGLVAAPGLHLWRDWVIQAINQDLPYDQFVRAQLTGYRSAPTRILPTGEHIRIDPRPEDMFAPGFLARGAVDRGKDTYELGIAATETASSAFLGLTVSCAKCHDHKYDPISVRDFYAMKALFDPLTLRKVPMATPSEIMAHGKALEALEKKRRAIERPIDELIGPYMRKLFEERVALLPEEVRVIVRKSVKERSPEEQKIADDYFPVLRIDPVKIQEIMPAEERRRYDDLLRQLTQLEKETPSLPAFWTVEVDKQKAKEPTYILTTGEPDRPEKDHPVEPGWPFAPAKIDFQHGRLQPFCDWLTAPENPLFARVAVNRLWQWHFGEGLQKASSDFGKLGGVPVNQPLLDWLAAEFVQPADGERRGVSPPWSMRSLNRLIVTSDTYKLASTGDAALIEDNSKIDPDDKNLWRFRLQRLEAEPVWDAIFSAAGDLDMSVGGPSFDIAHSGDKGSGSSSHKDTQKHVRRGAYLVRGYAQNRDVVPHFLQAFDADDGRLPCPMRTQSITAPQALFLMNSPEIEQASAHFGERLRKESKGDLKLAVDLAYRIALSRPASAAEKERALAHLDNDPARLKGFAWILFNLDEFIYVR